MNLVPTTPRRGRRVDRGPAYPFVAPQRHPNCLFLVVHLHGAPCRRMRRRFFIRMHGEARRLGIVMAHKLGVCLLFGAERMCTNAHRHQMLTWLIDQPEVASVDIGDLAHLADIFQEAIRPMRLNDTWADAPLFPDALAKRVASGAVAQWTRYLDGRMS